ncbi:MAG: sugar ABC transporter substrate-binding protein [Firmicutes bacterium]|nr:sugar ABC transporter substrate-binding protein [Bacillota bacterium]
MRFLRIITAVLSLVGLFFATDRFARWLVRAPHELQGPVPRYKYRVASIVPTSDEEGYWRQLRLGMEEAAVRYGVGLEFGGSRSQNDEHLVDRFKAAIAARVDGIICYVEDNDQVAQVISQAVRRGITVITVGSDVPASGRQGYVGPDAFYLGYEVGRTLRMMKKEAKVAVLLDGSTVRPRSTQARYLQGLRQALASAPGLRLVHVGRTPPGVLGAQSAIQDLLSKEEEIEVICCFSPHDTLGVARVLRESDWHHRVILIGTGLLPETLHLLAQGVVSATVASYPLEMGFESIRLFHEIRTGGPAPRVIGSGTQFFRPEDAPVLLEQLAHHEVENVR